VEVPIAAPVPELASVAVVHSALYYLATTLIVAIIGGGTRAAPDPTILTVHQESKLIQHGRFSPDLCFSKSSAPQWEEGDK